MKFEFLPFPEFISDRLKLRQATDEDGEEILYLRSNKRINQFIKRQSPNSIDDALEFIHKITKWIESGESIYWSICLKESPKMIGSVCLWNFSNDGSQAEVGYDLHPDHQNQGIMSEALKCILNYGFEVLKLKEIEAYTHFENKNSKILLIKNNFKLLKNKKDKDNENNLVFVLHKSDVSKK